MVRLKCLKIKFVGKRNIVLWMVHTDDTCSDLPSTRVSHDVNDEQCELVDGLFIQFA